jgi:sugar lactone lactonase YvrE
MTRHKTHKKTSLFSTLISGLSFTECPRWHDGRLFVSDYFTHRVLAISRDGVAETVAHVPGQPAGLGFMPDNSLLISSMKDRKLLRLAGGSLTLHADLSALAPGRLNEMLVDHDGRAWVGNFGFDLHGGAPARPTALICVEPNGAARIAAKDLGFPNGTVLTPDRSTLILAETLMKRLSAFPVSNGVLGERRTWASFGDPPSSTDVWEILTKAEVAADGICLDAEGAVWLADVAHGRVLRVAEGGKILHEIAMDGLLPFACMLGGDHGRTLFVCAAPTYDEVEAAANHQAVVLMTEVDVPHAGLP